MKRGEMLCAVVAMMLLASAANAATTTVYVYDDYFNPSDVNIQPGDTVHWFFYGFDPHTTTSSAGQLESWDSGTLNYFDAYDHIFTKIGTFNYFCEFHGYDAGGGQAGGMAGSIHVAPEPATAALLAAGMGMVLRRNRKAAGRAN